MDTLEFPRVTVHLSTATLVSTISYPDVHGLPDPWHLGRPEKRKGLDPDILFACVGPAGDTVTPEVWRHIEINGEARLKVEDIMQQAASRLCELDKCRRRLCTKPDKQELHTYIAKYLDEAEQIREHAAKSISTLNCLLFDREVYKDLPSVESAQLLVRIFPPGVVTQTLSIQFESQDKTHITDQMVDDFLCCIDPRRRTYAKTWIWDDINLPPDLCSILDAMLMHLQVTSVPNGEWKDFSEQCADLLSVDHHRWKQLVADRLTNIGRAVRSRPSPDLTQDGVRVEMLPYPILDCELQDVAFWEEKKKPLGTTVRKHRRLFHLTQRERAQYVPGTVWMLQLTGTCGGPKRRKSGGLLQGT